MSIFNIFSKSIRAIFTAHKLEEITLAPSGQDNPGQLLPRLDRSIYIAQRAGDRSGASDVVMASSSLFLKGLLISLFYTTLTNNIVLFVRKNVTRLYL